MPPPSSPLPSPSPLSEKISPLSLSLSLNRNPAATKTLGSSIWRPRALTMAHAAALASGIKEDLDLEKDLEALLRDSHPAGGVPSFDRERERELNVFRSGSAPPTVEGSRAALGSLYGGDGSGNGVVSEEEMISDPAYFSYYNYNKNLNPRLPPPAVSKEEWILAQRLRAGAIGDGRRKELSIGRGSSSSSLFSSQPGVLISGFERGNDGVVGLDARRSFADALQADLGQSAAISRPIPRPISHNAIDNAFSAMGASDSQLINLQNGLLTRDVVHSGATSPRLVRVQSVGPSISQSFAPGLGSSPARSLTPDPQLFRRSRSPCLPPIGSRMCDTKKRAIDFNYLGGVSSPMDDFSDVAASLGGLSLSKKLVNGENKLQGVSHEDLFNRPEFLVKTSSNLSQYMQKNVINKSEADSSRNMSHHFPGSNGLLRQSGTREDLDVSMLYANGQMKLPRQLGSNNIYPKVASGGFKNTYQNADMTNSELRSIPNDYSANQGLPAMLNNQLDAALTYMDGAEQHSYRAAHQVGSGFKLPKSDPLYVQYMQHTADSALQAAGALHHFSSLDYLGTSDMELSGYSNAYLGALLAQQKLNHDMPFISNSDGANHGFVGNPAIALDMQYPMGIIHSPVRSSLSSGSPLKQNERLQRFPSMVRGITGGSMGFCKAETDFIKEGFASSLLEEFKNNKNRSFELSEVVGHAVDFSRDQYGSRFIQQKLETASAEEKHKIFSEILPCVCDLMTDVFGNYVIQKFFEHGTEIQRKQLASEIMGHVLPLSFQMYGCRVIQKALEVVDVDQQTRMAAELDGSVMKCVRDQNGNHVIQKCIECIPQEKIQFIISAFCGQVVALSSHPYGCRVIQRVLEHCDDAKTQSMIMDEILQAVGTLAQDQYGNYVVQHILQHGKPEERSAIISKLAGQIVKMSQQKFASNVIEKCLACGSPEERQLLINEMLGSTDKNEPLQAMMKDQFGNYVVQKVLETCSDQNRELILSRIRLHLNALKKYTYGKHIVARVEKLLATGERRGAISSNFL